MPAFSFEGTLVQKKECAQVPWKSEFVVADFEGRRMLFSLDTDRLAEIALGAAVRVVGDRISNTNGERFVATTILLIQ